MTSLAIPTETHRGCFLDGGRSEVAAPVLSFEMPERAARASSPVRAKVSRKGKAVIGGVRFSDDSHNFSNERADANRIVLVGIGGGVALPFMFIKPVHGDVNVK